MAQVNKISSFKSFTELKNQDALMKLREENNTKRQETVNKIGKILDEMGLTSLSELEKDKKQALIGKMFGSVSEDRAEEIEDELKGLGKTKKLVEGNAFIYAAAKARQEGKEEFEFNGKKYKVTLKKDTGLKESYQLLITEATRWQFGIIDKGGNIQSNYVHYDGHPSSVIPEIQGMNAAKVKKILKDSEKGGMSSLNKYYNDSDESTIIKSNVKDIKKYLKEVGNEASAEYVYLYDERDGKWYGADVYTDKKLKPVEQLQEALVNEALSSEQKMVATFVKKVAKEFGYSEQDAARFITNTLRTMGLNESLVNESHFAIGDKVKCIDSGKTGVVVKLDKEHGEDDEKYYTVKVDGGGEMKYAPNELELMEAAVTEGKDDFMARFGSANINLKKGYKHHTEDELNDLYDKLGDLVKTLKVKDVTLVFESEANESVGADLIDDYQMYGKPLQHSKTTTNRRGDIVVYAYDIKFNKHEIVFDKNGKELSREIIESFKNESVVNEAEIKSDVEFKEYAFTVLKKAFGDDFDEVKAEEVVSGILKKSDGDYGAAVGMLTSSLG